MQLFSKRNLLVLLLLVSGIFTFSFTNLDEGMFPLSDLERAGLKEAGLKIDKSDIFNPGKVGLVDALVRVGGCTGSFISDQGLIITNHHCAFGAVQLASSPENDYLTNGFVARSKEKEIPAQGLTIRITDSYEDVSDQVLAFLEKAKSPAERVQLLSEIRSTLVAQAEKSDPSIEAEVSEMFIGKSYVLFRYRTIKDVRLVYIPQRNIGEFGGETDNWVWPRHTGDYSFLRAYVAQDGSPAEYSEDNVPYKPKKFLKVNPDGVKEEDFAFILGYPGRTFRHRPSQYIQYQQDFLLPYVSDLYDFQNKVMLETSKADKSTELALVTRIKRNANVVKNYRGKLKGLRSIQLVDTKKQEDIELARFINSNAELKNKYGNLMGDIEQVYQEIFSDAQRDLIANQLYSSSSLITISRYINTFKTGMQSSQNQRDFYAANIEKLKDVLSGIYESYNYTVDSALLLRILTDVEQLPVNQQFKVISEASGPHAIIKRTLAKSKLRDQRFVFDQLLASPTSLQRYNDRLMELERGIQLQLLALKPEQDRREGVLNKLMGDYVAVKELFQNKSFVPDANSTLRLTYGYIRGYSPADATYFSPFTTIKGIIEKGALDNPEYSYPSKIADAWSAKDFGRYAVKELNDVPVNLLYNMDTTGGNSGSPIMNSKGELIGVNFDRAYDATINDFAWNESYSRSIGVDIRYILWVADKIDRADFLLAEMGIN